MDIMDEFPSNSRNPKAHQKAEARTEENRPRIEKVVTGEIVRRKPSMGKRFLENFIGGKNDNVGHYVLVEVLLPAARDMLADASTSFIEGLVYGEGRRVGRTHRSARIPSSNGGLPGNLTSKINYQGISSGPSIRREDPRERPSHNARINHDFDEFIFATRVEADEVLNRLRMALTEYDAISVADFYGSIGVTPDFTDYKWGWYELPGAHVSRARGGGYVLDLPKPVEMS
jgi:hypothetical protein